MVPEKSCHKFPVIFLFFFPPTKFVAIFNQKSWKILEIFFFFSFLSSAVLKKKN